MGPPALALVAALCTALSDGTAMAVFADGTLDRAASLRTTDLRFALAAGISVGGLGPLIAAGSVRSGLRIWLLQVLLTVIWLGVWACLSIVRFLYCVHVFYWALPHHPHSRPAEWWRLTTNLEVRRVQKS